jgi:hypothetical protein
MVSSLRHLLSVVLAVLVVLVVAGGTGAQEPEPPQPPPIPEVPTMPNIPTPPDVPEVPEEPKDLADIFNPLAARMILTANPRRAAGLPANYRINGWVMPPKGVGNVADFFRKSLGLDFGMCKGRVNLVYKAAGRVYATRSVALRGVCSFQTGLKIRSRARVWGARRIRLVAHFSGNDMLKKTQHSISLPVP